MARDLGSRIGSSNSLPRVVFVCPAPVGKNTVLTYCDSDPELGRESASRETDYGSVLRNIPQHLGLPSHGKVSYCARILPYSSAASIDSTARQTEDVPTRRIFVVTGGEDGNLRLFQHAHRALSDQHSGLDAISSSSRAVSGDRGGKVAASERSHFLQEVNMPGNVAVKAIAFAARDKTRRKTQRDMKRKNEGGGEREKTHTQDESNSTRQLPMTSDGILIAVGGRLTYSLWEYSLRPPNVSTSLPQDYSQSKEVCESPVEGLSFLTSGSVSSNAEQDHRILAVQCMLLPHWYGMHMRNTAKEVASCVSVLGESAAGSEGSAQSKDDTCHYNSSAEGRERGGGGGGGEDDVYLVVMGDSRGIVTVATYEHGFEVDPKGKNTAV
jgi:hypothetical protein